MPTKTAHQNEERKLNKQLKTSYKGIDIRQVYSSSYFFSVLRGLFPKLDDFPSLFGVCDCGVLGLCGPLPLDRGLSSPFSSPTRGLYKARGL